MLAPDALSNLVGRTVREVRQMGNLGIQPEPDRRVILLDWAAYAPGTPGVEIAWWSARAEEAAVWL